MLGDFREIVACVHFKSGERVHSAHGGARLVPWSGYLKQRLDKIKRIKVDIYCRYLLIIIYSIGAPCAVRGLSGAVPKMDDEFFIQI